MHNESDSTMIDKLFQAANENKERVKHLQAKIVQLESQVEWLVRVLKRHDINPISGEKDGE